jgi:hypothetical protein
MFATVAIRAIPFLAASVLAGSLASSQRPVLAAPCSFSASGDIGAEWSRLGGAAGPLGCPTQSQQSAIIDLFQNFQHGQIVTSPHLGPHATLTVYVDSARELNVVWDNFTGTPATLSIGTRTNPSSYLAPFSYSNVAYTPQGSAKFPITGNEDVEVLECPLPPNESHCSPSTTNMAGIDSATLAMAPPPPTPAPAPALTGVLTYPAAEITFSDKVWPYTGVPLSGSTQLTLYQNGNFTWSFRFHDASAVTGYDVWLAVAVPMANDPQALTFEGGGHVPSGPGNLTPAAISCAGNSNITALWPKLVATYPRIGWAATTGSVTQSRPDNVMQHALSSAGATESYALYNQSSSISYLGPNNVQHHCP